MMETTATRFSEIFCVVYTVMCFQCGWQRKFQKRSSGSTVQYTPVMLEKDQRGMDLDTVSSVRDWKMCEFGK